jgi:hypothetical protein
MRDRGYITITKQENTLTGTIDPKTATVLNVRGVSIGTIEWIPSNVPPRGPPAVSRNVIEFRNIEPLTKLDNGMIDAHRSYITPDLLKQYLVEMSDSTSDLSFKYYPGTGDPKVCKVDLSVVFSK